MADENFSPEQSLQVIQAMIEKAKNQFSENGHLYLLWGWVIFIASAGEFILLNVVHYQNHSIVWFLPWLAVIYQAIYLAKRKKEKKVTSYADRIIGYVWVTFFILIVVFGFILGYELGESYYKMICPFSLALYGMPTLLCGIILRFKPLIIGAIGCWMLSIGSIFVRYDYQLLFLSAAMIVAWIIPGYILRNKYQKQKD
jgi:hypothetical protein